MTLAHSVPSSKAAPLYDRAAFALIVLLTLLRLCYASRLGLAQDEAHYWQWSRHPGLSYYDQGPGIAWCIRMGTLLLGDTPLGVRLVTILMAGGTAWLAYRIATRWTDERVGLWTLLFLSLAPLFAAGGLLATYDVPQVFFWTAALAAVTWTVQEERAIGWYGVGLLVGLGGLCKVTMLLFAPCVLLFLIISAPHRRWLRSPHPWAAFLLAIALFAPVVLWNAGHDWVNLRHASALTNRTRNAPPLRWFGDFLGGQAGLLGPFLFLAELYALTRFARSGAHRFLVAFGGPILALCLCMSLRSKLEPNWPVPTHVAGMMAVGAWFCTTPWKTALRRRAMASALLLPGAIISLLIFFPALLPVLGVHPNKDLAQKLNEPYGWSVIASRVQQEREALQSEGKPVFIAGTNYRVNSILAFYLPDRPETVALYLGTRRDQYWFWSDPGAHVGENAILVLSENDETAAKLARQVFDRVDEMPPVSVTRPGFPATVKEWHIFRCHGFHGYDPERFVDGY